MAECMKEGGAMEEKGGNGMMARRNERAGRQQDILAEYRSIPSAPSTIHPSFVYF